MSAGTEHVFRVDEGALLQSKLSVNVCSLSLVGPCNLMSEVGHRARVTVPPVGHLRSLHLLHNAHSTYAGLRPTQLLRPYQRHIAGFTGAIR